MPYSIPLSEYSDAFQVHTSGPYVGDWHLNGLGGNDTLIGWYGNDTFEGGSGDDYLVGGVGLDDLYGDSGNDTLYGEEDADYLDGGSGSDLLYGGAGNDTLYGGGALPGAPNADFLYGGSGNDQYYHNFSAGGITVINDLSGNEFNNADTLRLLNATGALSLRWGSDRSTLFIYQAGEFDDGTFDNGVVITGMLTNLGARSVGTIENMYVNGSHASNWLTTVENGWQSTIW